MSDRKCKTPGCRNTPQPGELLCTFCEIASWTENLKIQPCGHPASAVVQADEGTAYCGACVRESVERR